MSGWTIDIVLIRPASVPANPHLNIIKGLHMDINRPTLMDNKDLRNVNPAIQAHSDASEKEVKEFSNARDVVRDDNKNNIIVCPFCHSDNSEQLRAVSVFLVSTRS